jgi:hypothetical protein
MGERSSSIEGAIFQMNFSARTELKPPPPAPTSCYSSSLASTSFTVFALSEPCSFSSFSFSQFLIVNKTSLSHTLSPPLSLSPSTRFPLTYRLSVQASDNPHTALRSSVDTSVQQYQRFRRLPSPPPPPPASLSLSLSLSLSPLSLHAFLP